MSLDYLCLTVLSQPGENESSFKDRLSQFWTHMLRNHKADFEKVYAEKSAFESVGNRLSRQYLVEAEIAPILEREWALAGLDHERIDPEDRYSKYEATPPDWMWIEH